MKFLLLICAALLAVPASATGAREWPKDGDPVFSPSGETVAFVRSYGTTQPIMLVDANGAHLRTLATVAAPNYLGWSPDGASLVYSAGPRHLPSRSRQPDSGAAHTRGSGHGRRELATLVVTRRAADRRLRGGASVLAAPAQQSRRSRHSHRSSTANTSPSRGSRPSTSRIACARDPHAVSDTNGVRHLFSETRCGPAAST